MKVRCMSFQTLNSFFCRIIIAVVVCAAPIIVASAQEPVKSQKPQWAETLKPPMRIGHKCFIGTSPTSSDRNQAHADAYKNALFNVIEREFPDLISISSQSSERLEGSSYTRDTAYKSEHVQFNGLVEDKESPYIEGKNSTSFMASRLLCWSESQLIAERARQAELKKTLAISVSNRSDSLLPINAKPGPTGELEVVTIPPGASILLESSPIGTSNSTFGRVVAGTYELVIQKDGFEIDSRKITIAAGQRQTEKIELKRITSQLTINSEPGGAVVYLDNKPQDEKTPLTTTTVVGDEVEIRVELDDYFTEKRSFTATHRPLNENFQLKPQDATLSILSTPPGAEVFLDGGKIGKTNEFGKKISGGRYNVEFKLDGYEVHREQIEVWKSKPLTLRPTLKIAVSLPAKAEGSKPLIAEPETDFSPFFRFSKRAVLSTSLLLTGSSLYFLFDPVQESCDYYAAPCDKYGKLGAISGLTAVTGYSLLSLFSTDLTSHLSEHEQAVESFKIFWGGLLLIAGGYVAPALYDNVKAGRIARTKYDESKSSTDAEKYRGRIKTHRFYVDMYFPSALGTLGLGFYWLF